MQEKKKLDHYCILKLLTSYKSVSFNIQSTQNNLTTKWPPNNFLYAERTHSPRLRTQSWRLQSLNKPKDALGLQDALLASKDQRTCQQMCGSLHSFCLPKNHNMKFSTYSTCTLLLERLHTRIGFGCKGDRYVPIPV